MQRRKKKPSQNARQQRDAIFALINSWWEEVHGQIKYIVQYGHYPVRPDQYGPNMRLMEATDALLPLLKNQEELRFVMTPVGADLLRPFTAKTAHEALSIVLNPGESLFGFQSYLAGRKFKELMRDAQREAWNLKSEAEGSCATQPPDDPLPNEKKAFRQKFVLWFFATYFCPENRHEDGTLIIKALPSNEDIGMSMAGPGKQSTFSRRQQKFLPQGWRAACEMALQDGNPAYFRGLLVDDGNGGKDPCAIDHELDLDQLLDNDDAA